MTTRDYTQSEDTLAMRQHASRFKDDPAARKKKELDEDEELEMSIEQDIKALDLKHMDLQHPKQRIPPVKSNRVGKMI